MWLLSLVLAGGLGTAPLPSPERLLYPSNEERLTHCLTPRAEPTDAQRRALRERTGNRQVFFLPPAQSLRGACTLTDPRYPLVAEAAREFEERLRSGQAPPALVAVTLMAPIRDFAEVGRWRAWLVLRDGFGQEVLRWPARTGMTRQLVPGQGLSILIFDPPGQEQRPLVRRATSLWVEVDWSDGKGPRRYDARALPQM
ncbi:hypothetical protein [Deinococcus aestuarii]|uniref:hypothetical protein n=1 Tax=Deinococcus aestuarii TaxID=2774531 RepID=UPI001C0D4935|nr:hypothetical protein [Deinococcus aestuarii]